MSRVASGYPAAPLVEADAACEFIDAGAFLKSAAGTVFAGGSEGTVRRWNEKERDIVMRFERETSGLGRIRETIRENITGLHEAQAVWIIRADVTRAECEACGVDRKGAGIFDHISKACIGAPDGELSGAETESCVARIAA